MSALTPIHVVKLGGSLLELSDLAFRLDSWLSAHQDAFPDAHRVIVVGGGRLADAVRRIDTRFGLDEELAHWLCIDVMEINAKVLHAVLPSFQLERNFDSLQQRVRQAGTTLFAPRQFLRDVEPTCGGTKLPANWNVTSDSIAGRLAIVLSAERFLLLKHVVPSPNTAARNDISTLAQLGYVDRFLTRLERTLPLTECVDLPKNRSLELAR